MYVNNDIMHIKVPNTVERPKLVSVKNKKGDLKNKAQQRDLQYHQGRNGRDLAKYKNKMGQKDPVISFLYNLHSTSWAYVNVPTNILPEKEK